MAANTVYIKDANGNTVPVPISPVGQTTSSNSISVVLASDQVVSTLINVGSSSLVTNQLNISNTITNIANSRTGNNGIGRISITLFNYGNNVIYVSGSNNVTTSNGFPITQYSSITLNTTSAIYGITSSGNSLISIMETF